MHLRPLGNNIMFKFLEETGGQKGRFHDVHKSGIIVVPSVGSQKVARWGEVVAVGPKVEGISPGDFILIEALMWMEGVKFGEEGEKVWKTDDSKVLVVTNDRDFCQTQAF